MTEESKARTLIEEARELLRWAAPGPWRWTLSYEMPSGRKHWALTNAESAAQGKIIDASLVLQHTRPHWLDVDCPSLPNWQLIARAPDLLSQLCDELDQQVPLNKTQAENIVEFQREQETFRDALRGVAIMLNTELAKHEDEPWAQRVRACLTPKGEQS